MDYTKVPRGLIYKERTNLNDFGVDKPGTINHHLFSQMRRMTLLRCGDAKKIALRCFNNAYYICTLIQLDEFPDLSVDKYEALLLPDMIPFPEDVYQASMALVCVLLAAYDDKYKQKDEPLIESIHHWTSHNKWMNSSARKSFEDIIEKCSPDGFSLAPDTFAPRDIVEVIENANVNNLILFPEYICERLALLEDQRQRMYWANKAIAHLKDDLQEIYEDYGYDPKTDSFEPAIPGTFGADPGFEEDFERVCKPVKEALAYFEQQYKKNVVEVSKGSAQSTTVVEQPETSRHTPVNKTLQERIKVLEEEITRLQTKVAEAQQKNGELTSAKESVETRYNELLHQLEPDEKLDESTKLGIDERVIFISTALGLTLDKGDTNQTQLAKFISIYSGDDWKSIRSRIVNINKELAQERETPGNGLSQGTKDAVKNVKDWLGKIGREIAPATKRIISEIDDIYLNKKE